MEEGGTGRIGTSSLHQWDVGCPQHGSEIWDMCGGNAGGGVRRGVRRGRSHGWCVVPLSSHKQPWHALCADDGMRTLQLHWVYSHRDDAFCVQVVPELSHVVHRSRSGSVKGGRQV
jgi:hypothetical protein